MHLHAQIIAYIQSGGGIEVKFDFIKQKQFFFDKNRKNKAVIKINEISLDETKKQTSKRSLFFC